MKGSQLIQLRAIYKNFSLQSTRSIAKIDIQTRAQASRDHTRTSPEDDCFLGGRELNIATLWCVIPEPGTK